MYCTLEDIKGHVPERRLVELTDDLNPNDEGSIVEAVVAKAIDEAATLVDAYIGKRYALPLPSVPPVLRMVAVDLSIYNLYERLTEMDVSDGMKLRYNNAVALLKQIASGDLPLGLPEPEVPAQSFSAVSMVAGGPALFTMDSMRFM